jgi:hypothetical protein
MLGGGNRTERRAGSDGLASWVSPARDLRDGTKALEAPEGTNDGLERTEMDAKEFEGNSGDGHGDVSGALWGAAHPGRGADGADPWGWQTPELMGGAAFAHSYCVPPKSPELS